MATEEGGGHVRVCQYSRVLVVPDTCTHAPSLSVVLCLSYCVFGGTRIRRRLDWHTLPATPFEDRDCPPHQAARPTATGRCEKHETETRSLGGPYPAKRRNECVQAGRLRT